MGSGAALESLAKLIPYKAHRLRRGGSTEDVSASELNVGDELLVKPGEKVPADSQIIKGSSSFNESMLTGESNPVFKTMDLKSLVAL